MNPNHLPYWLAAIYLPQVGPRTFMRWLDFFPDVKALFHASRDELLAAGVTAKHHAAIQQPDWESVGRDMAWVETSNHYIITWEDESYPRLLKDIPDPLSYSMCVVIGMR